MRLSVIFIGLLAVLAGGVAVAGEERVLSGDAGFRLTYGASGPASIDVAVNNNATIKFMWLAGGTGTGAGDVVKTEPAGSAGNSTAWALRSALPPRNFAFGADGPDSCYVELDTATEVIVSW